MLTFKMKWKMHSSELLRRSQQEEINISLKYGKRFHEGAKLEEELEETLKEYNVK